MAREETQRMSHVSIRRKKMFCCAFTLNSSDGISFCLVDCTLLFVSVAAACRGGVESEQIK